MSRQTHFLPLLGCLLLAALPGIAPAVETATDHSRKIVSPESIEGVINVDSEGLIGMIMKHDDLVLIDSRIISDRNDGYIEGSISLPDTDTNCDSLAKAAPSLASPLMFYCNGIRCGRSARAAVIARNCKYLTIYWFRNGMEEWQEKEYPLVQWQQVEVSHVCNRYPGENDREGLLLKPGHTLPTTNSLAVDVCTYHPVNVNPATGLEVKPAKK